MKQAIFFITLFFLSDNAFAQSIAESTTTMESDVEISAPRIHMGKKPVQSIDLQKQSLTGQRPSLDAALEQEANIQVVQTPLKNATVSLNGMSGEHVAIAMDGDPLVGRIEGSFDARTFLLGSAQKISIFRGLDSLPFGSQNVAGAINVESPWEVDKSNELGFGAGSLGRTLLKASHRSNWNAARNHFWASASNWRSEAVTHVDRPQDTILNAVSRSGFDLGGTRKSVFRMGARDWDLRGTGVIVSQNSKGLFSGERTVQDQNRYGAAFDLRSEQSRLRFSWNRYESQFKGLATDNTPNREDHESEQLWRLGPHFEESFQGTTLLGGLQGELQEIESTRLPNRREQEARLNGYGGLRQVVTDEISAGAGVRYDSRPELWSPRGELTHVRTSILGEHETSVHSGLGFRDVTAKERYLEFENSAVGYRVVGNPQLSIERAWMSDLRHALRWSSGEVQGTLSLVEVQNAIGYVPSAAASGIWTYANVGDTRTIGVSGQWKQNFSSFFSSRIQYQHLNGSNRTTGGELFLQPAHRVSLQAGRQIERGFSLFGNAVWTARQAFVDSNRNGLTDDESIPVFWMSSVEAGYGFRIPSFADLLHIYVRVENIFDIVRPQTFPVEPRTFMAGFRARL